MPAFNPQTGIRTPVRSRKLGTAFRSLVTTLAHHYEVIAPDLRLRFHTEFDDRPFDSELLRSVRFRSRDRGDIFAPNLLPAPPFGALVILPASTPLQVTVAFSDRQTFRIKAFSSYPHQKLASRFNRLFFRSPPRFLSMALRIVARNSFRFVRLSFHPASDLPCDSAGSVPRCVPTDFCFPLLRLR